MRRCPPIPELNLDGLLLPHWAGLLIRVGTIAFPVHVIADERAAFDLALIVLVDVGLADRDVLALVIDPSHAISRLARKHGRAWARRGIAPARAPTQADLDRRGADPTH